MKALRILLIIVAVVCIGVAVSYPIRYKMELDTANEEFESLSDMRKRVLAEQGLETSPPAAAETAEESAETAEPESDTTEPAEAAETESDATEPAEVSEPEADATESAAPVEETAQPSEAGDATEKPKRPSIKWGTKAPDSTPEPASDEGAEPDAAPIDEPTEVPVETEAVPIDEPAEVPAETATEAPAESVANAEPAVNETVPTDAPTEVPVETEDIPTEAPTPEATQAAEEAATPEPTSITEATPTSEEVSTPEPTYIVEETPIAEPTSEPEAPSTAEPEADATSTPIPTPTPEPTPSPTPFVDIMDFLADDSEFVTPTPTPTHTPKPTPSPTPKPTITPEPRDTGMAYLDKPKVTLDEDRILPELKEIYALNHDLVGWLYIEDTNIDYPVVQHRDRQYYLRRDFYGKDNANGQIILDTGCDPYTPSYNLIISGHHMNSGAMFGRLQVYKDASFWRTHKIVEFDSLMERKQYVVFAAFYSADYDENEEGFRYSVNIQYKMDYRHWIDEIESYRIYPTGIDVQFGDEFITLTTCDHSRRNDGRFVVVARRIREGEKIV